MLKLPIQISIRDLLLSMAVSVVGAGWLLDHLLLRQQGNEWEVRTKTCAEKIEALGWDVRYRDDGIGFHRRKDE